MDVDAAPTTDRVSLREELEAVGQIDQAVARPLVAKLVVDLVRGSLQEVGDHLVRQLCALLARERLHQRHRPGHER